MRRGGSSSPLPRGHYHGGRPRDLPTNLLARNLRRDCRISSTEQMDHLASLEEAAEVVVFNGEDFSYWKARTKNYLKSQGHAIWSIVEQDYEIPANIEMATPAEVTRYANNSKAVSILFNALGRKELSRVSHLRTAHAIWEQLGADYEDSDEVKSKRRDIYNRQYQRFAQKPGESLDDTFARFEAIVCNLRACGDLAYSENERAKQFLYSLDENIWGFKICAMEENPDFDTLDCDQVFSKLKCYELARKLRPNYEESSSSVTLPSSSQVHTHGDAAYVANPSYHKSALEFAVSCLIAASNEQMESIPDEQLSLLTRKFKRVYSKRKEMRRASLRGCFECGDQGHYIADCPKNKKKFGYRDNHHDEHKKKNHFAKKDKTLKKLRKAIARVYVAALSDFDLSSSEEEM